MMRIPTHFLASLTAAAALFAGCDTEDSARRVNDTAEAVIPNEPFEIQAGKPVDSLPKEWRLQNVRQLTFGGENAEAYWSSDGRKLIMQCRDDRQAGDQIFILDLETGKKSRISDGTARTTCAYFLQGDQRVLWASTHAAGPEVPQVMALTTPSGRRRYVWGVFESYDIYVTDLDGTNSVQLTDTPGYDAEATVCPVTGRIVFTSARDGDLELYSMEPDGSDVTRLTDRIGYDGGAFFSPDGSKLVQRSGFPKDEAEKKDYLDLLAKGMVTPSKMEITVLDRDGSNFRQVTDNGKANFGPFWHPDNERILFASNMKAPRGRDFDLYMIHEDGTGLEQVTFNNDPERSFDGFPMFSPDGKYLVFGSNRYGEEGWHTNVFVAEWIESRDN